MALLVASQEITESFNCNMFREIQSLTDQSRHLGFLLHNNSPCHAEWDLLEQIQEFVLEENGQFISLDIRDFGEATLPSVFYSALENSQSEKTFRINLPRILKNNPKTDSPFINRAILWQRLCDRILEDVTGQRRTILVLENFDCAAPKMQHDTSRLIRFHLRHQIPRTFLLTLHCDRVPFLDRELRDLAEVSILADSGEWVVENGGRKWN
ncbi:MAG: hypothetical protein LBU34_01505 [Planctomycetaceae bacterium]|jgi:hypothetical protein|nr:hypothetical protein [Planctomycetaceae bacterium]